MLFRFHNNKAFPAECAFKQTHSAGNQSGSEHVLYLFSGLMFALYLPFMQKFPKNSPNPETIAALRVRTFQRKKGGEKLVFSRLFALFKVYYLMMNSFNFHSG